MLSIDDRDFVILDAQAIIPRLQFVPLHHGRLEYCDFIGRRARHCKRKDCEHQDEFL